MPSTDREEIRTETRRLKTANERSTLHLSHFLNLSQKKQRNKKTITKTRIKKPPKSYSTH
jgi:hypothetical protein